MKSGQLSPQFLADLAEVAPTPPERTLSPHFLDDLEAAHVALVQEAAAESPSDEEIRFVAKHLEEWRSDTRKELKKRLDRLPKDDLLFCPISLFATMDYGRLETAHTRALAWLLDPEKEHGFGSKLLEALLVRVGGRRLPIEVEQVENELPIDQPGREMTGRIDVFATGAWIDRGRRRIPWLLVIEAKVDAWEGEEQLARYEEWVEAQEDRRRVIRVFLTPEGWQPETARQDWFVLSFQELVETLRPACEALRDKPGFHFLRYYLAGVLRDVCHWPTPMQADCDDPYAVLSFLKHVTHR